MKQRYILISPCRNEAAYMRKTLDSVVAQSIKPSKWLIVDDGSTDETPQIIADYVQKNDWIEVISRSDRGHRAVGPGVVDAFYAGYDTEDMSQYDYLCKLDMDLELPPGYFEILMDRMHRYPQIGSCSGKSYIYQDGKLISERMGDDTSLGMTKFYRVEAFQQIGGFVREVMWDGIDCHRCRMLGWIACSWDDEDLRFIHLRPMGTSQVSIYQGRMRGGYGQYFMGTSWFYMLASSVYRMTEKPYVLFGLFTFLGWLKSAMKGLSRYDDLEFRRFLRDYHWRVLRVGKVRAIAELHEQLGISNDYLKG